MSPKINVLEITESTTAGVRRHLLDLVTHLDRSRFSVSVVCSTLRDQGFLTDMEIMKRAGTDVIVVPMQRSISPVSDWTALLTTSRVLKERRPDIVHTHSSKGGFIGRLAARLAGVPIVIHTPHVFPFEMDVSAPLRRFYFLLERVAARWTDRFVCVSRHEQEFATRSDLDNPEKFVVIENGIETGPIPSPSDADQQRAALGLSPGDLVVGMVGRFTAQKGHRDLVLAAEQIVKRLPLVKFVLIGEGETRREVEEMVGRRRLHSHFVFTGAREDVRSLYPLFDVFVMPSLWESLPYSLLEAMAAARPVVATRVGGMPEIVVDRQNGRLVPPKDPVALAGALTDLLEHADRRTSLGAAARARVEKQYRLDSMIRSTEALYSGMLDAKVGRR